MDWQDIGPSLLTIIVFTAIYFGARYFLSKRTEGVANKSLIRSIILIMILLVAVISFIISLPLEEKMHDKVINLIGILLSAVFALGSATFIGNGLAGIMLRTIGNFQPGDFVRVKDTFGRVTEQGLFHTEIQSENNDLVTVPNLFIVNNPVNVLKKKAGILISSEISLGYDVPRLTIEAALLKAGECAGLKLSYVNIVALGDFSVLYRIQGLLEDVENIIEARSKLNACVLDCLHEDGIEIVSPTIMNQRQIGDKEIIPDTLEQIPVQVRKSRKENRQKIQFAKGEAAAAIVRRQKALRDVEAKIKSFEEALKGAQDDDTKVEIKEKIERAKQLHSNILNKIDAKLEELSENDL